MTAAGGAMARLRRWAREPLVRFALLGIALFAVDRVFTAPSDLSRVVVTAGVRDALRAQFRAEHGHAPDAEELQAQLDRWIDEEVLYREALALGLDRHDVIVRRQLTQKMRFLIEDRMVLPEPTPQELQAWLDAHVERYGKAQTVSFEQVFLSRGRHGHDLVPAAEAIARQLSQAPDEFVGLGDPFLVGQVVADAGAARVRKDFGDAFEAQLEKIEPGRWTGPVASGFGLHLVRVTARGGFQPARLDEVFDRVRTDWRVAQREALNQAAMKKLREQYRVEEPGGEG